MECGADGAGYAPGELHNDSHTDANYTNRTNRAGLQLHAQETHAHKSEQTSDSVTNDINAVGVFREDRRDSDCR